MSLTWMRDGTSLFLDAVDHLGDDDYAAPSGLPGWTRAHLVAHVAANADALRNLVHWAATGVETPMYASPRQRADDIAAGALRAPADLRFWAHSSAAALAGDLGGLDESRWQASVVTAQGRTVPATEILWMRSREVWIHAVDLDTGITFADLPTDFLTRLVDEIAARRGLDDVPAGPLADVAAYLAGRPHGLDAEPLGPWL
ncbi:maleylpyruvate isomerase family mycothiol-dependent enzyme [Nocardioides nitrophenolicus]|uniref:maleylpyruvate isomerase family mycothiol-dependent enzyme n=1 Tax=Nocardioides nitrophenolicus TaxID=60489 RepID=UPI001EF9B019|nr:maleylpyruvate isomerase family mycothiol-dependent enzyme [Nocardioides nitrophenolicus]MBM7516884.1 maleylpyruvate isomerase [Nocardioides nitrophenolicus]